MNDEEGEEGEYNKQTSKNKMWEKRLNENYFKLFRRRNMRRSEEENGSKSREECNKMAAALHWPEEDWLPFAKHAGFRGDLYELATTT